jgi:hypothetical protein
MKIKCPHCLSVIQNEGVGQPTRCRFCGGAITYGRPGFFAIVLGASMLAIITGLIALGVTGNEGVGLLGAIGGFVLGYKFPNHDRPIAR